MSSHITITTSTVNLHVYDVEEELTLLHPHVVNLIFTENANTCNASRYYVGVGGTIF